MSLPDPELQPEFYKDVPVKRTLAWGVDLIVTLALTLVGVVATFFVGAFFLPVLFATITVAYRTVMLARYGATLGMMMTALSWRGLDGSVPDTATAFYYSVVNALQWVVIPLQIGSIALILLTPYRQGLNDILFRTTMLHRVALD